MKRTITIAAYNRAKYLEQVMDSLSTALDACPEFKPQQITIGIDPLDKTIFHTEVVSVANTFLLSRRDYFCRVIVWPEHLGVNEHPRRLLQYAFEELESGFNVHLEDDTVLSPDALRLALWFSQLDTASVYTAGCLAVCLHNPSLNYDNPERVYRTEAFGAWGWGCHYAAWSRWLAKRWNHKRELPIGWDWSITETMRDNGLRCFAPSLSRVRNIGRLGGTYQTPQGYDHDFAGQVQAGVEHMVQVDGFRLV